jgi:hypothetical protein
VNGERKLQGRDLPLDVLWCADSRRNRGIGWAFPYEVDALLSDFCAGRSVLHLFGGNASWGTRLDIDPLTRPDVVGDAWLPPFAAGAFDVVVLDPPYFALNGQVRSSLFWTAAMLAREHVVWFHTIWAEPACKLERERAWLVRVGRSSAVRCLIFFRRRPGPVAPVRWFSRGPAIRYNKWLMGQRGLPFADAAPAPARASGRRRLEISA